MVIVLTEYQFQKLNNIRNCFPDIGLDVKPKLKNDIAITYVDIQNENNVVIEINDDYAEEILAAYADLCKSLGELRTALMGLEKLESILAKYANVDEAESKLAEK